MAKIKLENLKSIRLLDFEIPSPGVHILTSVNGSGKTTLLTCIERIVNPNAFQKHFRTSSNDQFDNFRQAKITYTSGTRSVKYQYRGIRWVPTPRSSNILSILGFSQVIYVASSQDRFYFQNQNLNTRNISSAAQDLKDGMNEIFETNKFDDLRRIKLTGKGRGNSRQSFGFVLPLPSVAGQSRYFSEKNFSLGEILVLNALLELVNAQNNGLILIDEIELALHPKVQIKFLKYLERLSSQKNLTIILSTHSSSLIKAAPKLIFLSKKTSGIVEVEYDCYPAIALQNVAVSEEVQPDFVFFTEDTWAQYILEEFINYYFSNLNTSWRPIIKILPVAGFKQTINFTVASATYLIPRNTQVYCVLDNDVLIEFNRVSAKVNKSLSEQEYYNTCNSNIDRIKYLPITPELGIVNFLRNNPNSHILPLQHHSRHVFDIAQIINDENTRGLTYSANPREEAKTRIKYYIDQIRIATNWDELRVKILLAQYYASDYGVKNSGQLKGLLNPIFV